MHIGDQRKAAHPPSLTGEAIDSRLGRARRVLGERYVVERELGHGGSADVYLAFDRTLDRPVAAKILRAELVAAVSAARFLREVAIGRELEHPNILPIHEFGRTGGDLFYTMPYIDGQTLRDRLRREHQLSVPDALAVTGQLASALDYAHARGVIHRDVKPGNILFSGSRAMVADFGIARAISAAAGEQLTDSGLALGTPEYMSPEQGTAQRDLDGRSDVYGLACVVYEMLAGEPPFTGASPQAIVARHCHEAPRSLRVIRPSIAPAVEQVIERGLAKVPADRFGTAGEFAEALRIAVVESHPPRQARARWISSLAAVGVAALVIATVLWLRRPPPAADPERPALLAVLNFETMVPDEELAVIGRALARDLIDALRRAPELAPLSYEAIRTVRSNAPLDSLRAALGVATFVTGVLEPLGDSIRVSVRIVDAGTLLETGREPIRAQFARAMLLQLRDTVIDEVGRRLLGELGQEVRLREWRTTARSPRAWALRQRAQEMMDHARGLPRQAATAAPQLAALAAADSLLLEASATDPAWPEPHVARGWVRHHRAGYLPASREAAELVAAESLANVALSLRPGDPGALELRGTTRLVRWVTVPGTPAAMRDSAGADLHAVLRVDDRRPRTWHSLSLLLDMQGDTAGATRAARRAQEVDAYNAELNRTLIRLVFRDLFDRRPDSARLKCVRAIDLLPEDALVRTCRLSVLGWYGHGPEDIEVARRELEWTERSGPFSLHAGIYASGRFFLAAILARSGQHDSASTVLHDARARLERAGLANEFLLNQAQVVTALGDRDDALRLLEAAVRADPTLRDRLVQWPWFDPLRPDPRFVRLISGG